MTWPQMQVDQIETFLDLLDTQSFNRTADRLSVTQSTISGRVKAFEKALGERLFERSRSGTQPTTAALLFETHARVLRRAWADGQADVKPFGSAVMLRIGIQHDLIDNQWPIGWPPCARPCPTAASTWMATISADAPGSGNGGTGSGRDLHAAALA